jgi:phage baseplate assembly protein V
VSTEDRLYSRIKMMTARATITATDDSQGVHYAQVRVTPRETIDKVPVVQIYGFGSHAKPTSEAHLLFATGDRSKAVAIATNDPDARPRNLQPGEVSIYTDEGDIIILKRNHEIEITTTGTVTATAKLVVVKASDKVRMETPRLEVTGDIIDHCDSQGHTAANMREIYNSHTHPNVQNGPGSTGVPSQPQREGDE